MKNNSLTLLLIIVFGLPLFSQSKLIKQTKQQWNLDTSSWLDLEIKKWEYDDEGREILYKREYDEFTKYEIIQQKYDENGNLTVWENKTEYDGKTEIERKEFVYDANSQLKEKVCYFKPIWIGNPQPVSKIIYDYNELEGRKRSEKYIWKPFKNDFFLEERIDSLFDDKQNVIKIDLQEFNTNLVPPPILLHTNQKNFAYDEQGRLLEELFGHITPSSNLFYPKSRSVYSYLENGKVHTVLQQKFNANQEDWISQSYSISTVNDKMLLVRNLEFDFTRNPPLDSLTTFTYDGKDRMVGCEKSINGFLSTQSDIFYEEDENGYLVKVSRLSQNFFRNSFTVSSYNYSIYDYSCEGLLLTEIEEELPKTIRFENEYDNVEECSIKRPSESVAIFPNPSAGIFVIESKLLAGSHAVVRVFSPTGQEIYHETVSKTTETQTIDIAGLSTGNYYLFIQNGELSASKRILITE